ncbi:MAG: chemotaxis protein CheW [Bacillota bacterium]
MNLNNTAEKKIEQYVIFLLNDKEFGVNIHQTREILSSSDLTFIPNAPNYVSGVINLRGEIVPVVNLKNRLQLEETDQDIDEEKIIIVAADDTLVGMKVDNVEEIIRLEEDNIEKPPKISQKFDKDYVSGVGKLNDKLLILLDLNKILTQKEIKKLEEIELN